jgi:hypothetical protein
MAKASDNVFPYVHVAPAAAPASPSAGSERLFLDSGDGNKLKRKNSSGTVTTIEGGSAAVPLVTLVRTAGDISLTARVTRTALDSGGALDFTIAAVAGDKLEVIMNGAVSSRNQSTSVTNVKFTASTRVSGADVNSLSGGYPSAWFAPDAAAALGPLSMVTGHAFYTVQAGDISGGNVTLRPYYYMDDGGVGTTRTLYAASGTLPLTFAVKNLRQ